MTGIAGTQQISEFTLHPSLGDVTDNKHYSEAICRRLAEKITCASHLWSFRFAGLIRSTLYRL
jgi:hypothetical protein